MGAVFSPCGTYRYRLERYNLSLLGTHTLGWVLLNPSTADEIENDPTIRRCINFTVDAGFSGMALGNLYGYRATDPDDLEAFAAGGGDPVGPFNDHHLARIAEDCGVVVCAWGVRGKQERVDEVLDVLSGAGAELYMLRLTKGGHPEHPLYLPKSLRPVPWVRP